MYIKPNCSVSNLKQQSPKFLKNEPPVLLHDNARPHTAKKTIACINALGFHTSHPPYSPDIAPTDYHVFRSLQHHISNKIYQSDDEVKADISIFLRDKPKTFWSRGIFGLPERWEAVISKGGDYIWLIYFFLTCVFFICLGWPIAATYEGTP